MKKCSLAHILEGETATIAGMTGGAHMTRRLKDIGLVDGAQATALFRNHSLRAYLIKGAVIAIRDEDARKISVWR